LAGLGKFITLYGLIILVTALSSGFVGDSLTVLDRHCVAVRAALQNWALLLAVLFSIAATMLTWFTGLLDPITAVGFGTATALFLLEDCLRRLLMANIRFWRIVMVDSGSLVVSLGILLPLMLSAHNEVTLAGLFFALAAGQGAALIVAILLVPSADSYLVAPREASMKLVAL